MIVADSNLVTDGLVPRPLRVPGRNLMTVPISLFPPPVKSPAQLGCLSNLRSARLTVR
jgi:hypothetical protein